MCRKQRVGLVTHLQGKVRRYVCTSVQLYIAFALLLSYLLSHKKNSKLFGLPFWVSIVKFKLF